MPQTSYDFNERESSKTPSIIYQSELIGELTLTCLLSIIDEKLHERSKPVANIPIDLNML